MNRSHAIKHLCELNWPSLGQVPIGMHAASTNNGQDNKGVYVDSDTSE